MLLFDLTAISLRKSKIGENSGFVVSELIVRSGKKDVFLWNFTAVVVPTINTEIEIGIWYTLFKIGVSNSTFKTLIEIPN